MSYIRRSINGPEADKRSRGWIYVLLETARKNWRRVTLPRERGTTMGNGNGGTFSRSQPSRSFRTRSHSTRLRYFLHLSCNFFLSVISIKRPVQSRGPVANSITTSRLCAKRVHFFFFLIKIADPSCRLVGTTAQKLDIPVRESVGFEIIIRATIRNC